MTQTNYCNKFRQDFEDFYRKYASIDFAAIASHFSATLDPKAEEVINPIAQEKDSFTNEFQNQVKELFKKWYRDSTLLDPEGIISRVGFEDSGRIVINGSLDLIQAYFTYFPDLIRKIKGDFLISGASSKTIDALEEVDGNMSTDTNYTLASLKKLRKVGSFECHAYTLECLDALEEVLGDFTIGGSRLKRLPSLKRVTGEFKIYASPIESIDNLVQAETIVIRTEGKLTNPTTLKSLINVGTISLYENTYRFPALEGLENAHLSIPIDPETLPVLKNITGGLDLRNSTYDNFKAAFPSLRNVGSFAYGPNNSLTGNSFYVTSEAKKREIELLKSRQVFYSGGILVSEIRG